MIVLDTSALIYWTLAPDELTKLAKQTIEEADGITISSISIWEIGIKAGKGHLQLPMSIAEYTQKLLLTDKVEVSSVGVNIWLKNLALTWDNRDPADRTIVATASLLNCPLVTSDRKIRNFYKKSIW